MSDHAKDAATAAIDATEAAAHKATELLGEVADLGSAAVAAPLKVGDAAVDVAVAEAQELIAKAAKILRSVASELEALP